ncbi:sodium-extruding oxaloacetate decarboxylase subunit alpha [Cocleimonas sp. KMM 6892]|jgi:oxaloacetate decarboxylase alpha subunit|uniref:sodium-extruding oxaloacetate decarboxylase subunit alpha n=1 Tax=unclassified Cocleimonas TaxID=2639732 RepID=UPI002DBE2C1F|nr:MULTISPECIES: sodium-extruding oxaloacetate decarboxylase subunit alpha [unclassified Cocleimonas]MEB8433740.1 sodium-extruding oxaloacetate decarboxylase subunit alpha [Cocleimonas sp. KMM 6892]MEC4716551.1 sodium-extruding oxaloacetate decarboxylase subunit alpha [Cocleimonas sp. KMM 6895]MEC4746294.1 sodium-extruding oxaloacetate decarboxylase subunit alpha [Cocleimonas sp. KMM 6896]
MSQKQNTSNNPNKLQITDVVLRDGHQSLFATRMRLADMLPIAEKLDNVGYWSVETWGGATFDSCIRFLGEDPWDRIRQLKAAMPKTPQQMLFRAQNILGYRHYADDVVNKFVERAAINGVDVFRVFDAMNDTRNMETALKAVKETGKHAQATMSYTVSPVHDLQGWLDMAKRLEDIGSDSLCIKDMAGLLKPYAGFELVSELKKVVDLDIHVHCHATTGLSCMTNLKCAEAGAARVDTSISSMSMTYGHSSTESMVATMQGTDRDTGLDLVLIEEISAYFREVRKKYAKWEGSLKGIDSRILLAQVPGGMLTNMEGQLKEQGAGDKLDEVLAEIPRVRKDLGYIPLVTPTSQIVGTQAVLNVLTGERYKKLTGEAAGVLRGEYGATPSNVNEELQKEALAGDELVTCRPADLLESELDKIKDELVAIAKEKSIELTEGEGLIDDVLTYALFPQVGLKFLENRNNPDAFEPIPTGKEGSTVTSATGEEVYTVTVDGVDHVVTVGNGGDITGVVPTSGGSAAGASAAGAGAAPSSSEGEGFPAPMAGNVFKVQVAPGDLVDEGDVMIILEAMKMEITVIAPKSATVVDVAVKEGDDVALGDILVTLA